MLTNFETSDDITEIAKALNKVQAELVPVKKTSDNPFFKSKYADLTAIWLASRGSLTKNGLALTQFPVPGGIVTQLMHVSGQWMRGFTEMKADKQTPQATGSAITYARRYSQQAILGLPTEDDDGNAASQPARKPLSKTAQKNAITEKYKKDSELSEQDASALFKVAAQYNWTNDQVKSVLEDGFNYPSTYCLNKNELNALIAEIKNGKTHIQVLQEMGVAR